MMSALSMEEVLAEEVAALHGESPVHRTLALAARRQDAQDQRTTMNADKHPAVILDGEVARRASFYRSLNKLNHAALCCSGGGIRSATFCLGVIQALAACNVAPLEARPEEPQPDGDGETTAANSLLGRFQYLSTVSGGGYIGSWLSAWRTRDDFATIIRNLISRPDGADVEPPEISWLRAYSNYLTPRLGITSADGWTAVAICVRNLVLNWLIIVPIVCCSLLILKIIATGAAWIAKESHDDWLIGSLIVLGLACLIGAQAFTFYHRPTRRPVPRDAPADIQPGNVTEGAVLGGDLIWAVISAVLVAIALISAVAVHWVREASTAEAISLAALGGAAIYAAGWIVGASVNWIMCLLKRFAPRRGGLDFVCWTAAGLAYGALVGAGAELFAGLDPYGSNAGALRCLLLPIIFGVPWVLLSQLIADTIFVGLASYEADSDAEREWLGRFAGWLAASGIAWGIVAGLVFAAGNYVQEAIESANHLIVAAGGATGILSGIATALLGSSGKTPAKSSDDDQFSLTAIAYNVALALAGPIFVAVLIIALSVGLDMVLLPASLVKLLLGNLPLAPVLRWLAIGLLIAAAVAVLSSFCVNINRFSLHALYRNRLIRAYLGASRQARYPDRFTGFDDEDNVRMHKLWPPRQGDSRCLFHIVNIALNVVSTKRLAWQERKAEPFTVSPRHCGTANLGYRRSEDYGDSIRTAQGQGIALGTAMAISGAAVSPNMGYHSSPSIALLLTLLNVRLGWWLGNPGAAGDRRNAFRREGPEWAALPLLFEAFGQTTDDRRYVYLSDGGHFENLGLYEMVRRRCRFFLVIDAGCDLNFAFEDLGNALRKIHIDLGVRIEFVGLERLRNRPPDDEHGLGDIPYYALGTVHYEEADGSEPGCGDGTILYIKPAYHGSEGAAVRSYATANPKFPHEPTVDQWFSESQFESYRSLGLDIGKSVLEDRDVRTALHQFIRPPPQ